MAVGILALQGCIEPHLEMLRNLNISATRVTRPEDLKRIERIILPGGESSTMLKLLNLSGLFAPLKEFCLRHPTWGICAGAILAAQEVVHPCQQSLNLIPVRAHRNYYGSQLNSFKSEILIEPLGERLLVDFIRAPRLEPLNTSIQILARHDEDPVLLRKGHVLISSFHAELEASPALHRYFVEI